jgi:hypothetical protein
MRNADRIREMNDMELSEFLCEVSSYTSEYRCEECMASEYCRNGHKGFIDWLQEEYEETKVEW